MSAFQLTLKYHLVSYRIAAHLYTAKLLWSDVLVFGGHTTCCLQCSWIPLTDGPSNESTLPVPDQPLSQLHTHTHPFNGPFSGTTQVSQYQKGKTNLDFTRDSEWQWHQLGCMQVCTSLQTDNHASTPSLCFLQAGCPSCHPTNSVKALKEQPVNCC